MPHRAGTNKVLMVSKDFVLSSNLLRPSGVRLQSAALEVKVYGAEDLPQSNIHTIMEYNYVIYIIL